MVGIGNPCVEWNGADLKSKRGKDQQKPDDQAGCCLGGRHFRKDELTGFTIDQADPIGEQAGRKNTQDKKLEPSFV